MELEGRIKMKSKSGNVMNFQQINNNKKPLFSFPTVNVDSMPCLSSISIKSKYTSFGF